MQNLQQVRTCCGHVGYQVIIIGQQQLQRGSLKATEAELGNGCHNATGGAIFTNMYIYIYTLYI